MSIMYSVRSRGLRAAFTVGLCACIVSLPASEVDAQEPTRQAKKPKTSGQIGAKFQAERREFDKQRERTDLLESLDLPASFVQRPYVSQEIVDEEIELFDELIETTDPSHPEYPEYLFRLADLHFQKKKHYERQAGSLYQRIYDAQDDAKAKEGAVEALRARQREFQNKTRAAAENIVKVYGVLVSDPSFASYKRLDESLYYRAVVLGELGEDREMQGAFGRLIADFPSSPFIPNAYLAFADHYFGEAQFADAVPLYQRVLTFEDSPVYGLALYKLGWCHLNPIGRHGPRYDKSLGYFVDAIQATLDGKAGSEAKAKRLRQDARRDLVRAYVHVAKPSRAWAFFTKVGNGPSKNERDARAMLEGLAREYFGSGQYTDSTFIYQQLQALFPDDAMACEWQDRVVTNTLATDDKDLQWRETEALVQIWTGASTSELRKSVKRRCEDTTHDTLVQLATAWHREAVGSPHTHTHALAEQAYEAYLLNFPSGAHAHDMQYFYAELLWAHAADIRELDEPTRRERAEYFRRAHAHFVKTLERDPEGEHTADAAYAQALAIKHALDSEEAGGCVKACKADAQGKCITRPRRPDQAPPPPGKPSSDYPESDYTPQEREVLAAYEVYTKLVNIEDDPRRAEFMHQRAKLMMAHNKFDAVEPLLVGILTDFDDIEDTRIYAAWSAPLLVELLTIRWRDSTLSDAQLFARSEELEDWLARLQGMKLWAHPDSQQLRETTPELLAEIGWRRGTVHRDAGQAYVDGDGGDPEGFQKCAAQFIDLFNDFEDHARADTLLWKAADCSDAAYLVGQGIALRQALLERFPDSEHAKDALHELAESYEAVGHYEQSAARYEQYVEAYARDPRSSDALQNAYLFRLGLGQDEQARGNLKRYESLYKKRDVSRAAALVWSHDDLLDGAKARRRHAVEYLDSYGTRGGLDRAIVAEAVIGQIDWRQSCDEPLLHDSCINIMRRRAMSGSQVVVDRLRTQRLHPSKKRTDQFPKLKPKPGYRPPKRCGSSLQAVLTIHRRDRRGRGAQARFAKILKLVGDGERVELPSDDPQRIADFRDAWAMAMFYAADEQYEAYLRTSIPKHLDFWVEDWRRDSGVATWERQYAEQAKTRAESQARIKKYLDDKLDLGRELQARYATITETRSAHWTLAAAARSASMLQYLADQVSRADVPANFSSRDRVDAYCDALADRAEPIRRQALVALERCLAQSAESQLFNEYSRLCEVELQQHDAERYPATQELFGVSVYTTSEIVRVGVLGDPDGGRPNPVVSDNSSEPHAASR